MIDIIKAKEAFKDYVQSYDITNKKIELKVIHTHRTVEVAKQIAESLKLSEEDIQLAELIGLLHDIGRFEQLKIYDTFNDRESINHGYFGVKLLFEDRLIEKFIEDRQYDDIIYKAIKNHNKYKIEEGLNERELLHAKIIRDADKTDIYAIHVKDIEENNSVLYNNNGTIKQKVTKEVLNQFTKGELVNTENCKNEIDHLIVTLSYSYDYYFEKGLEVIYKNKYIEKLVQQVYRYEIDEEEAKVIEKTMLEFFQKKLGIG